jgi:hypothetical protein
MDIHVFTCVCTRVINLTISLCVCGKRINDKWVIKHLQNLQHDFPILYQLIYIYKACTFLDLNERKSRED